MLCFDLPVKGDVMLAISAGNAYLSETNIRTDVSHHDDSDVDGIEPEPNHFVRTKIAWRTPWTNLHGQMSSLMRGLSAKMATPVLYFNVGTLAEN